MSYGEKELLAGYKRLLESNKLRLGIIKNLMAENVKLKNLRDELSEALELLIDDLRLRAKLRGDDCLDVSDGRLYNAQKAIAKARPTQQSEGDKRG